MGSTTHGSESLLGRRPDGYVVLEELRRGLRTTVYRAMDPAAGDRLVALEVMNAPERSPVLGEDDNPFRRAREVSRRVRHPGIARVHRTGQLADGRYYAAMELAGGMSLTEELRHRERIPWREAVEVARSTAEALGALHDEGIVHREVHPDHVMVRTGRDGRLRIKLLHLGGARLRDEDDRSVAGVEPGSVGTPPYVVPEHATGWGTKPASDVWAVGAMLYEMLAGVPALGHLRTREACVAHHEAGSDIPRTPLRELAADVPAPVARLVGRLLSRAPGDRPANGRALVHALRLAATEAEEEARGSLLRRFKSSLGDLLGR
ncbi:MAG: serine/threonine-protein kinase [Myxococcota bacterium]